MIIMVKGVMINPHRLTEARQARQLNISQLAEMAGVSRQAMSRYEQGLSNMSYEILANVAKVLDFPISFFHKADTNIYGEKNTVFYRSLKSSEENVRVMLRVKCEWTHLMFEYLNKNLVMPKVNLPDVVLPQDNLDSDTIQNITNHIREFWGLGKGPIHNLVNVLEKNGIIISGGRINAVKADACSETINGKPVIFYDTSLKSACRIRFSLAHELGHIVLHNYITNEDIKNKETLDRIEKEADTFASCFLMPKEAFINDVLSTSLEYLLYLKEKWQVSLSAIIYRCKELHLIDDNQNLALRKKISYRHWNKVEPLDNVITYDKPRLFLQAIEYLINHANLSKSQIINDFSLNLKDLSDLVSCNLDYWDDTPTIPFSLLKS